MPLELESKIDVLIVDDTQHNIQLLEFMLEDAGYSVASATSGQEAIDLALSEQPKLILLDVMMPVMDGFEACGKLKKNPRTRDIPVIFVTAKASEADETEGFSLGAVDYISKPINEPIVLARVKTHIELHGYRKSLESLINQRTRALNETLKELAKSNKIKDEFLATISHELRTPLNGINGMLHLFLDTELSQEQAQLLDVSQQSADDLSHLVENILVLTEAVSGSIALNPRSVELRPFIETLITKLLPSANLKKLDLQASILDNVPQKLEFDPKSVSRIINHLINNAIKFTDSGSVTLKVTLKEATEATTGSQCKLEIEVNDTGIGISQDKQDSIFSLFQQGESDFNRRFGGLGIGLPICQSLIESMEGELSFTSTPGKGTTFIATIPMSLAKADLMDVESNHPQDDTKVRVVLIVEDNPVNLMVQKSIVEKNGYQVLTAINGKEALTCLSQHEVNIILMDCQMPVMDGFETTRAIRGEESKFSDVTIIALTANATSVDRQRCLKAGMNDYLSKPVNAATLKEKLRKWS